MTVKICSLLATSGMFTSDVDFEKVFPNQTASTAMGMILV